jgi:transcription elongation GreA/GreB family factor
VNTPASTARQAETPRPTPEHAPVEQTPVSGVGSTVEAEDLATGLRLTYRLVEAHHAAPKEGRLSIDSPVGMVLRARRRGEVVTATTPRGHRRLRIISVT